MAATLLVLANAIASPGELWFWQPLLILGVVLALHIVLTIAASHATRLRTATAGIGKAWSDWRASRPEKTGAETPAPGPTVAVWPREPQSEPRPVPAGASPVPTTVAAEPMGWQAAMPYSSWPVARPSPAAATAATWPEGTPAWSASWPAPPAAGPRPATAQIRPDGRDLVLDGASANGNANRTGPGAPAPTWDQLEVAAASWLSQRAAEPVGETAR